MGCRASVACCWSVFINAFCLWTKDSTTLTLRVQRCGVCVESAGWVPAAGACSSCAAAAGPAPPRAPPGSGRATAGSASPWPRAARPGRRRRRGSPAVGGEGVPSVSGGGRQSSKKVAPIVKEGGANRQRRGAQTRFISSPLSAKASSVPKPEVGRPPALNMAVMSATARMSSCVRD